MTKTLAEETGATRTLVQAVYDALLSGEPTTLGELFADDLVVRQPPYLPWGGEHRTLAGVAALTGSISEHLNVMKMTVERIVVDGDTAIGLLRFPDLRTGENVVVAEELIVRDGKVAEARLYYHDTQAVPLNSAHNR